MHKPLTAFARTIVLAWVANGLSGAISHVNNSTVGCTEHALCLAVHIPVVGSDVYLVVLEVTHVSAAVYPPQFLAIELIRLDDGVLAVNTVIPVVKLDNQLHLAVSVEVGCCSIVRNKRVGHCAVIHLQLEVVLRKNRGFLRLLLLHATHYGCHSVLACERAGCVFKVRNGKWLIINLRAVTIDVVCHVVILFAMDTPCAKHTASDLNSHQSTVNNVYGALRPDTKCYHRKKR